MSAALVLCLATSGYAETQNVKVSGELRTRGYQLIDWKIPNEDGTLTKETHGWFHTRALVDVEADLTDNVMVAVEIEGLGTWGSALVEDPSTWRDWSVNLEQAYVKLSELYYTPLTAKIGRQYIGLSTFLVTDAEKRFTYDAFAAALDFYPWTVFGCYAKLAESMELDQDFDIYVLDVRYEAESFAIDGFVIYEQEDVTDAKPLIFGLVGTASPLQSLDLHGEIDFEMGDANSSQDLEAWALELGGAYIFDAAWEPAVSLRYIFGSGDDDPADGKVKNFNEIGEYDYLGYAYSPIRSNIHIINASLSVLPMENLTLIADYYHYIQAESVAQSMGDIIQDNGGYLPLTNGTSDKLGNELDLIAEYDYSEDVSTQLYVAWFMPGDAYSSPADDTIVEIRGEILVSF
ncbi:MAG: alginate export family protein [Candidatus Theseobacter exili]|nr:alginate export family protein [Candidatus Theseobacter exili]